MAQLLIIVSRAERAQFTYLKHVFGRDTGEVILDRRMGKRRQHLVRAAAERRSRDRRHRDVTKDLQTFGWALVQR